MRAPRSAEEIGAIEINPTTRVSDVADVVFGRADQSTSLRMNGKTGVGLALIRQAKSNSLQISSRVRQAVAELQASLPKDVSLTITSDDATFISGAIREVILTLLLATAIVVAIIYVFLRSARDHLHSGDHRADRADRHGRRDLSGGLLDQHPDAACPGARDRHGGRRRDRRGREHLAAEAPRSRAARRGGDRQQAGILRRRFHHRDARRRVHPDLVLSRNGRPALLGVRLRPRFRGRSVGLRRADALPDARLALDRRRSATRAERRSAAGCRRSAAAPSGSMRGCWPHASARRSSSSSWLSCSPAPPASRSPICRAN